MLIPLASHLNDTDLKELRNELDSIYNEVRSELGNNDRNYILRIIKIQRILMLLGRFLIFFSLLFLFHWDWLRTGIFPFYAVMGLGILTLGVSKILENMEISHNVMHGQWDWMNDPEINSTFWEWDAVPTSVQWKHSHNVVHHTWTNVIGKDDDAGFTIMRVAKEQPWKPIYLLQPFYNILLMLFFEWAVALHGRNLDYKTISTKITRQIMKDYVIWPLLAGPLFFYVFIANGLSNMVRNVWAYIVIFCGHFSKNVCFFTEEQIKDETKGHWYVRQILGSSNIRGGQLLHLFTGNLSYQIEHHLFPDMPSNRYCQIAPRVEALCLRYKLPYNSNKLWRQFGAAMWRIWSLGFVR